MIFSTSSALVFALATGLAAAKPIHPRAPEALPEYRSHPAKRHPDVFSNAFGNNGFNNDNVLIASSKETSVNIKVDNNNNNNDRNRNNNAFDFGTAFNRFNNDQTIIAIKQQNLQIVDNGNGNGNGIQQAVIEQAQQVLVVDQSRSRFNDLFRQSNYRRNAGQVSTVIMVVQQIQVAVDDGRGNVFRKDVFAQSAVVANRGRRVTQTVLVSDERVLIATQVLNGRNRGVGNGVGIAPSLATATAGLVAPQLVNGTAAAPTRTNNVALFDAKPTWSSVDADPAATLAAGMQAELLDALNGNAGDGNAVEDKVLEALKNVV